MTFIASTFDTTDELAFKACCAAAFQSPIVSYLLGRQWRPGGMALTEEMASRACIDSESLVLDVACGLGDTAALLMERFGCSVVGLDFAAQNLQLARGISPVITRSACTPSFVGGDAEQLPFAAARFEAALCECALSTFPDKRSALREVARVLRPGGRLALSDVALEVGAVPDALSGAWARVACLADALSSSEYQSLLQDTGFVVEAVEDRRAAAKAFLEEIDRRLLLGRIAQALGKFGLEGLDIRAARNLIREALKLVEAGQLSYAYYVARTPG